MRLDGLLAAVHETALGALGRSCAPLAQHPLSMAAVLAIVFLLLTCSRARLADRQGALIDGRGNSEG
jgi:hypothetical protein